MRAPQSIQRISPTHQNQNTPQHHLNMPQHHLNMAMHKEREQFFWHLQKEESNMKDILHIVCNIFTIYNYLWQNKDISTDKLI